MTVGILKGQTVAKVYAQSCGTANSPEGGFSAENSAAPLVTLAKFQAAKPESGQVPVFPEYSEIVDKSTGEVVSVASRGPDLVPVRTFSEGRLQRWSMAAVARSNLPYSRTASCHVRVQTVANGVTVHRLGDHHPHYGGLQTCGSVWACPVCQAKIAARRKLELEEAIESAKSKGLHVYMLTLTHPHSSDDSLAFLLEAETKALTRMHGLRAYKKLKAEIGLLGQIRAWECTHGRNAFSNGWHPHFHILLITSERLDIPSIEARLFAFWRKSCVACGLEEPVQGRGVQLQDGSFAGAYVSKWGAADELVKSMAKSGRGSETPWDLLRAQIHSPDPQAAALFAEYAAAYFGKAQLQWSRGLRTLLELGVRRSDEEIAAEQEEGAEFLSRLSVEDWALIARANGQGVVLELLASSDPAAGLERYLSGLRSHWLGRTPSSSKARSSCARTRLVQADRDR